MTIFLSKQFQILDYRIKFLYDKILPKIFKLSWVHHIKSHGPRNFAVNIFWDHLMGLPNRKKCEDKFKNNKNETEKLNNFKILDKLESGRLMFNINIHTYIYVYIYIYIYICICFYTTRVDTYCFM